MKWKLCFPEPQTVLYYFAKLIGLAPFSLKNEKICPPKFLDLIYPIFVIATYSPSALMLFAYNLPHFMASNPAKLSSIAALIQHLGGFPCTFLTLMVFLLMNKKIVDMVDRLRMIGKKFHSLGIDEDNKKFFKHLLVTTTISNVVLVTWRVVMSYLLPRNFWYLSIQHNFENCIILNTILIFTQLLVYIRQRFTLLKRKFQDMFSLTRHTGSSNDLQMDFRNRNPTSKILRDIQRVQKIEGLHLELCKLLDQTTHLFTISLTFISLRSLLSLSLSCHWVYHVIRTTRIDSTTDIASLFINKLLPTTLESIMETIELIAIAHASATTCKEGTAMEDVLRRVWTKSTSQDLQDEFFTFHLQLRHKSASVSLFGFFDLYYSYVYKIFSAVMAYTILMIQFDPSQPMTSKL